MILTKPDTGFDEDGDAADAKRRKRKTKKKRKRSKKCRKNRPGDPLSEGLSAFSLKASDAEGKWSCFEWGTDFDKDVSTWRIFFPGDSNRTTTTTGRAFANMPPFATSKES